MVVSKEAGPYKFKIHYFKKNELEAPINEEDEIALSVEVEKFEAKNTRIK